MAISNLTKSIDMSSQDFIISQKDKTFTPNEMGKTMLKINNFDTTTAINIISTKTKLLAVFSMRMFNPKTLSSELHPSEETIRVIPQLRGWRIDLSTTFF